MVLIKGQSTMKYGHRGFTLMELMVTIAILAVVMALLMFPIFSAYGYIQKAQARTEAQRAGDQALQKMKKDLETASYIFEIPPDGRMVAFLQGDEGGNVIQTDGSVTLVQYEQLLDNPQLGAYYPFWKTKPPTAVTNPYILGRYAEMGSWLTVSTYAADPYYLLAKYQSGSNAALLKQLYRNKITAISPLGERWDVPSFVVTPFRAVSESLPMLTDAHGTKNPIMVTARYPMWAGRNLDWDTVDDTTARSVLNLPASLSVTDQNDILKAYLLSWYITHLATVAADASNSTTVKVDDTAKFFVGMTVDIVRQVSVGGVSYSAYDESAGIVNVDAANSTVTLTSPVTVSAGAEIRSMGMCPWYTNPFGYQIRVFDQNGSLCYGVNGRKKFNIGRHFMDWPPIDRQDWDWSDKKKYLWTKEDIQRQRLEGKLVFAQPATGGTMKGVESNFLGTGKYGGYLPIPDGWEDITYLVFRPRTIRTDAGTFTVVNRPADLSTLSDTQCCFAFDDYRKLDWGTDNTWQMKTRAVIFGKDPCTTPAVDTLVTASYTICDLQPDDVVVGTYSTKGVLDIALTMSRQDSAGSTPAQRRQDYTAKLRFVARNAMQQARSSR
ncbi:MAG TPA: type II secretion system protein [Armatimonadota bacterium]|nr:type II secretion system protein [Armatimonadota bacterium]